MEVRVDVDGKTETVEISVEGMTLRESVAVQKLIGNEEWDEVTNGNVRPVTLQAIVYAKLRNKYPGLKPDDIDFDLTAAASAKEVDPTETG